MKVLGSNVKLEHFSLIWEHCLQNLANELCLWMEFRLTHYYLTMRLLWTLYHTGNFLKVPSMKCPGLILCVDYLPFFSFCDRELHYQDDVTIGIRPYQWFNNKAKTDVSHKDPSTIASEVQGLTAWVTHCPNCVLKSSHPKIIVPGRRH